jgi:hypothetical protein
VTSKEEEGAAEAAAIHRLLGPREAIKVVLRVQEGSART